MVNIDELVKSWPEFSPIERLILIYLREGKSFDEIKEIIDSQIKLVASEILEEAVRITEKNIETGNYFKNIVNKLKSHESGNKRTRKKPETP